MKDRDNIYLHHIFEAIEKIERYISNVSYNQFLSDDMIFDAVAREFTIIGEATNNISKKFQQSHIEIPWKKMIGLRNVCVHEYFGVNTKVMWDTCQEDLKELKEIIQPLLK